MEDEKFVKRYFSNRGTVSKWWNPIRGEYGHVFQREIKIIQKYLSKDKNLEEKKGLELSVGKGRLILEINSLFKEFLGTDISKEMLEITQKANLGIQLKWMDAEKLTLPSNYYDYVFCLAALVHYPRPKQAMSEMSRVLKKGGEAIISVDNSYSFKRLFKKMSNKVNTLRNENFKEQGRDIFQVYSKKKLNSMFKQSNLKVKKIVNLGMIIPIKYQNVNNEDRYFLITPKVAYALRHLSLVLDKIPLLNRLCTYQIYILEKI